MTEGPETAASRQGPAEAPDFGSEPGLVVVEQRLGHALGQEQRASIAGTLREIADAWARHRSPVPDGTEPAFVFHPIPLLSHGDRPALVEEASHD